MQAPGLWGQPVRDLAGFAEAIMSAGGAPPRRISQLERTLLMERALQSQADALAEILQQDAQRIPGFATHMLAIVMQLKQAAIEPQEFEARLAASGDAQPIDHAVARAYAQYQALLKEADLFDVPGLYWAAEAACLTSRPALLEGIELLLLDNFDDFTRSELRLLRAAAGCVPSMVIGLHHDGRPSRHDGYTVSAIALRQLQENFSAQVQPMPEPPPENEIDFVAEHLFWRDDAPPAPPEGAAVAIVPCIDARHEAETIARSVRRLLESGVSPGRIAIAQRDGGAAESVLRESLREAGVPVRGASITPLSATPTGAALRALLKALEEWERDAVLEVLVSPLIWEEDAPDSLAFPLLVRKAMILAGEQEWTRQLDALAYALTDGGGRRAKELAQRVPRAAYDLVLLRRRVDTLRQWARDLAQSPAAALRHIIATWPAADPDALRALWAVLDQVELHLGACDPAPFASALLRAMQQVEVSRRGERHGVLLTQPENIRHHQVDHLFVLGVNEGQYPRGPALNAIYGRAESERLERAGVPMESSSTHAARERLVFLRLFLEARQQVTLTWRVQKESDREAAPSPFLSEIEELLHQRPGLTMPAPPAGAIIAPPSQAATPRGVANAAALCASGIAALNTQYPALARAMAAEAERWAVGACGPYDAMMQAPAALDALAAQFGSGHVYSVQQLESWLSCPFHFYQERILRIDDPQPFDGELTALDRGSLVHAILQQLHRNHVGRSLGEVTRQQAEAWLAECLETAFSSSRGLGLLPQETLAAERAYLTARLRRYLNQAYARDEDAHWSPAHFEYSFGAAPAADPDAGDASTVPPHALRLQDEEVLLAGRIDRIDTDTSGNTLRIIDYKTGSPPRVMDLDAGLELQLILYAMACEDALFPGATCTAACYVPVGRRDAWREALGKDKDKWPSRKAAALASIALALNSLRAGQFPPLPTGHSCHGCSGGAKACRRQEARQARKSTLLSTAGENSDNN